MKAEFRIMIVMIIVKLLTVNLKTIQKIYYRFAGELLKTG